MYLIQSLTHLPVLYQWLFFFTSSTSIRFFVQFVSYFPILSCFSYVIDSSFYIFIHFKPSSSATWSFCEWKVLGSNIAFCWISRLSFKVDRFLVCLVMLNYKAIFSGVYLWRILGWQYVAKESEFAFIQSPRGIPIHPGIIFMLFMDSRIPRPWR